MNIFHNTMVKIAGRRTGTGNALVLAFDYNYNADGLLDSMTRPNGSIVQTSYTARNQIDQILVDGAPPVVDYSYNLRGLMTGKTYESGGLATTISHDAKGQVLAVANSSNFGTLDQLGYGYDTVGQRTHMQRVDGRGDLYGYDNARQVTATKLDIDSPSTGGIGAPANDMSYAYDLGGNRSQTIDGGLATGYTANDVNEYTLVGADVPVYDNNGNLTSGDGRQMAWDAHNRLLSVVPATPVDGDLRAFYRYDGTGRRISKIVDKYDAGLAQWVAEQTRTFGYDGWNMVREGVVDTSAGAVETQVKRYTWGVDLSGSPQGAGGVGGLLMVEEDNDPSNPVSPITAYYYTNDANGNVTTVADSAGNPVAQYEYDPYGKVVVSAGVYADDNPYRFSTKFEDAESGWLYYGFRYYLPYVGRWLSRDPIGEGGGRNLYYFVGNNGVNFVDYLGMLIWPRTPPPHKSQPPSEEVTNDDGSVSTHVNKCNIVIFIGHNSTVPQGRVETPQCSAATVIACGGLGHSDPGVPGTPVPGAPLPPAENETISGAEAIKRGYKAFEAAKKHAATICGNEEECCKSVEVTVDCSGLGWSETNWGFGLFHDVCSQKHTETCSR